MKEHRVLYLVLGVVFLLLGGLALVSYHGKKETAEATAKAQQLQTALATAGLRVPPTDRIVRVLGDDGGAICYDPGDALRRSTLYGMLTNGAAGPGQRPVLVDNKLLQGQLLIMKVYCPQYVDAFQDVIDDLKDA
ncbi:hypothetical protein [Actinoplanes regularis]|uniref:DUF732 domain-containing protein n=1 Tax=Actinoplanes regularis TaxID=52697 RepID=A0A239HWR3_9ACTN|nr:hypothetical protein [Actinoplanes regularis]GIE91261.1 hypothetical protein Are01nite_77410 [Actinoplanes regularis]GLW34915.1 hypothetical protein Areg01_78510 [Actinoplanes regularis]SNS85826.1 hypothetical protein SAMN06264365_12672 [Actinoplanes regularis]